MRASPYAPPVPAASPTRRGLPAGAARAVGTGTAGSRTAEAGTAGLAPPGAPALRAPALRAPARWLARTWRALRRQLGRFGVVGALAYVVDVGSFNLLSYGAGSVGGWLEDAPLTAKSLSVCLATLVAWAGNRWWTFRDRRRSAVLPELGLFVATNGAALAISLLCLAFTVHVLGLTGPVAANTSANVVGVALGTAFRFYAYRTWVFRAPGSGG